LIDADLKLQMLSLAQLRRVSEYGTNLKIKTKSLNVGKSDSIAISYGQIF